MNEHPEIKKIYHKIDTLKLDESKYKELDFTVLKFVKSALLLAMGKDSAYLKKLYEALHAFQYELAKGSPLNDEYFVSEEIIGFLAHSFSDSDKLRSPEELINRIEEVKKSLGWNIQT